MTFSTSLCLYPQFQLQTQSPSNRSLHAGNVGIVLTFVLEVLDRGETQHVEKETPTLEPSE